MNEKDIAELKDTLNQRKKNNASSLVERIQILEQIKWMLLEEEKAFFDALQSDLGKSVFESFTSEIAVLLNEIDYVTKHLKKWMKPARSYHLKLGYVEKIKKARSPYGNVLVISPWNYPLQLALMPVINAVSAGNFCVIKPSEYAPATSAILTKMIKKYFAPEQLMVVAGDAETAKELIALDFDLLFFTGSQKTGKKVYMQAAEYLTPVIMELGGKNPCIIDESGFSEHHIKEIVWGKFLNAGQTCIAPDTLFVHQSIYEKTLAALKQTIRGFYGERPESSPDYSRIINQQHFDRLTDYITEETVQYGGSVNRDALFMEPTILTNITSADKVMREEIFGPVLPVVPYGELESLLKAKYLQSDALTAYIFSKKNNAIELLKSYMKSTISVNQVIHHAANPHVAFGGIGNSGFGTYHGKSGFETCSYERTYYRAYQYKHLKKKYPPYSKKEYTLMKNIRKWLL